MVAKYIIEAESRRTADYLKNRGVAAMAAANGRAGIRVGGRVVPVYTSHSRPTEVCRMRWEFRNLPPSEFYILRLYGASPKAAVTLVVPFEAVVTASGKVTITLRTLATEWGRWIDAVEQLGEGRP